MFQLTAAARLAADLDVAPVDGLLRSVGPQVVSQVDAEHIRVADLKRLHEDVLHVVPRVLQHRLQAAVQRLPAGEQPHGTSLPEYNQHGSNTQHPNHQRYENSATVSSLD